MLFPGNAVVFCTCGFLGRQKLSPSEFFIAGQCAAVGTDFNQRHRKCLYHHHHHRHHHQQQQQQWLNFSLRVQMIDEVVLENTFHVFPVPHKYICVSERYYPASVWKTHCCSGGIWRFLPRLFGGVCKELFQENTLWGTKICLWVEVEHDIIFPTEKYHENAHENASL